MQRQLKQTLKKLIRQTNQKLQFSVLDNRYKKLINFVKSSIKELLKIENQIEQEQIFVNFIDSKIKNRDSLIYTYLYQLLEIFAMHSNKLLNMVYSLIPELIISFQLYISQSEENKEAVTSLTYKGIEDVILYIYNLKIVQYLKYEESINVNLKNEFIRSIVSVEERILKFKQQFVKQQQITFANKFSIKTFLLFLYYNNLQTVNQQSVNSFFKLIYIYCGGQSKLQNFSSYLFNKKDEFSIFLHRISEHEFQWILLTLYQIYINQKQLKFEVNTAVKLIRKKSANQCKFKLNEIAQSLLHLLQNQYQDIF